MSIPSNQLIFLLGAGCSYEAGIPITIQMINEIEQLILSDRRWNKHKDLYYYIKSSILYADGIFGQFQKTFSIERFVNILSELERKDYHPLYPFIANWDQRLLDLGGNNFENITELKYLISQQLIDWITIDHYRSKAAYYQSFFEFQRGIHGSMRIFSLNYDLCFENVKPSDYELELGFDETDRTWKSSRFDDNPQAQAGIYLYKLHGSINWKRDSESGNILKLSDGHSRDADLIFGTDAKLQSIDPYLFYVHEFRKYSLQCKLIIIIGYSFSDHYINNLLGQALNNDFTRNLLVVGPENEQCTSEAISKQLKLKTDNQIIRVYEKAKKFLENDLKPEMIDKYLSKSPLDIF